jgi:hypothetical protein
MELSELLAAKEDTLIELCSTAAKEGRIIGGQLGGDLSGIVGPIVDRRPSPPEVITDITTF